MMLQLEHQVSTEGIYEGYSFGKMQYFYAGLRKGCYTFVQFGQESLFSICKALEYSLIHRIQQHPIFYDLMNTVCHRYILHCQAQCSDYKTKFVERLTDLEICTSLIK